MNLKQQQSGFTLIELVMVIVILGILAAVALPKFVDLKADAATSATAGIAGAMGAGSALNKASRLANTSLGIAVATNAACSTSGPALIDGGVNTTTYTITGALAAAGSTTCSVTSANGGTAATFVLHSS